MNEKNRFLGGVIVMLEFVGWGNKNYNIIYKNNCI